LKQREFGHGRWAQPTLRLDSRFRGNDTMKSCGRMLAGVVGVSARA
jgi:hypothetical protein